MILSTMPFTDARTNKGKGTPAPVQQQQNIVSLNRLFIAAL